MGDWTHRPIEPGEALGRARLWPAMRPGGAAGPLGSKSHGRPAGHGGARASRASRDWVLVVPVDGDAWVNGLPVTAGLRLLSDRDEICVGAGPAVYFSTERLACREPLPAGDRSLFCPRCKQEIEPGTLAIRCPGCGVWHHESEELPCWTYDATCALCPQATDPDAGFRWTPEEL